MKTIDDCSQKTFTLDKQIMGSCCSKKQKLNAKIIDTIEKGQEFDYLRPKGCLVYKIDSVYNVPKIDISFDEWYANSVHLWPKTNEARKQFLRIERTPPCSPPITSFDESDVDTIH